MRDYLWDGTEDSDEEISEMVPFKNKYESDMGVKYSKNGLKKFINEILEKESK